MIDKIKSRFAAVNADENGAETIEVVLLTVFFVLVIGGVVLLLKGKISTSIDNLAHNFDDVNRTKDYTYGATS